MQQRKLRARSKPVLHRRSELEEAALVEQLPDGNGRSSKKEAGPDRAGAGLEAATVLVGVGR